MLDVGRVREDLSHESENLSDVKYEETFLVARIGKICVRLVCDVIQSSQSQSFIQQFRFKDKANIVIRFG